MKNKLLVIVLFLMSMQLSAQFKLGSGYISLKGSKDLTWENDSIKFEFTPARSMWEVKMTNKIDKSVSVNWDETLFIINNNSSQIAFNNTILMKVNDLKGNSVIASNSSIVKNIFPVNNLHHGSDLSPVFNKNDIKNKDFPIRLIFPITANNLKKEYEFNFTVSALNTEVQ